MICAYKKNVIRDKYGKADKYESNPSKTPLSGRLFPSLHFYLSLALGPVQWLFRIGENCDDSAWVHASAWCGDVLEACGGSIVVEGLKNISASPGPCVFIANHMSTLETFLLPAIIRPTKPVTFVVKKSLVEIPLFGPVMRSRDPVVVGRVNPREDLAAVLDGGVERLNRGVSIVVFPQSTRALDFNEEHFNTIGIKLARKAKVPVVPLVLKTDAWGQGRHIKEAGRIRIDLPVRFKFGEPIEITGNGKNEHQHICGFIAANLSTWQKEDGVNR